MAPIWNNSGGAPGLWEKYKWNCGHQYEAWMLLTRVDTMTFYIQALHGLRMLQKSLPVNTVHYAIHKCRLKLYRVLLKRTEEKRKTFLWSDGSKFFWTTEERDHLACYQLSVQKPASLVWNWKLAPWMLKGFRTTYTLIQDNARILSLSDRNGTAFPSQKPSSLSPQFPVIYRL